MNFLSIIEAKREGKKVSDGEIHDFIHDFTDGKIPDYQMAAMLMAIYFRGLNTEETRALTLAMRDSGDTLKFPRDKRPLVDKHSSGGVGDKISLPLAPLLACLGFRVPMVSGRGLGITGGTLDKLDSIPGFKTVLPTKQIIDVVQKVGCVICGQTERMVPADKKLYALRDVTGTVPSIPLIVSSILSKKLAENIDALVLDVKFGTAAFMQTKADARALARAMVSLGNECGVNTRALLTDMNTPIGRAAGNWLEVKETVECLSRRTGVPPVSNCSGAESKKMETGRMPVLRDDLRELVIACAAHLLLQTHRAKTLSAATKTATECLDSGAPLDKWNEMLDAQGADLDALNKKLARDYTAPFVLELKSSKAGFISRCDARVIGEVIRDLGGGRLTKESTINYDVGIDGLMRPGEAVKRGSILVRIHAAKQADANAAAKKLETAFEISAKKSKTTPLISQMIIG
ncbi:MAG TPA: thymidine phosphorylase [Candidatus Polarisedimenticolia bacterium]|nr:thymidine phosphorylase [Candidatus Polarisedimenticolia bacterium]